MLCGIKSIRSGHRIHGPVIPGSNKINVDSIGKFSRHVRVRIPDEPGLLVFPCPIRDIDPALILFLHGGCA